MRRQIRATQLKEILREQGGTMGQRSQADDRTVEKQNEERMDTLQKYVSDMIAVEEHIGSAVKRQVDDPNLNQHNSQASQLIHKITQTTESHEQELKRHLESIGGDTAKGLKEVATAAMGTLAGLYGKVRNETVSKMLRDDYTALNLAAVGYTMLHTTGLMLNDQTTASLALRHLKDYTAMIMEINQIIPSVVVADLSEDGSTLNEGVLQQALSNTQEAWQPSSGANNSVINDSNGKSSVSSRKPRSTTRKSAKSAGIVASGEPSTPTRKPAANKTTAASKPLSSEASTTSAKRKPVGSKNKRDTPSN